MGTIHHHVAVMTTWRGNDENLTAAWESVKQVFRTASGRVDAIMLDIDYTKLLVGPVSGVSNGYATYMMIPDGSKEGWETSDVANSLRDAFVSLLRPYGDVAVMSFGELNTTVDFENTHLQGSDSY